MRGPGYNGGNHFVGGGATQRATLQGSESSERSRIFRKLQHLFCETRNISGKLLATHYHPPRQSYGNCQLVKSA